MSEANQTNQTEEKAKEPVAKMQVQNLSDLASFSTFVVADLSKGQQVSMQLNYRHGMTEDAFFDDFQKWYRILDRISQDGGDKPYAHFWNGAQAKPAQPANPDLPAAPALPSANGNGGKKRNYKDPLTEAEKPAELVEVNRDVYEAEFDYFIIKPDLDEKSVVEFWKDGLDFPVGAKMNKWKHDTIREKLSTLGLDELPDPSKPQKIRFAGVQYWAKGSEYTYKDSKTGQTKTTNYKDLLLLKPAL